MSNDETRLGGDATKIAPGSKPSSGWLSSSGSIDHGRFEPGAVLEGRYRVIGLLGRGGMGEVYRADDLRLGQPVALKFLPDGLSQDPERLAQFHNEVRTARQVSHPNVLRMYDIGEIEGHPYLTMEYVDGEDLATSLRRIGRFPEDKALDIARQLSAGLAAAHERGVVHRDLKPANVMLDGAGKVRIMDFGLAAVGDVENVRAGTPAYMAPEQLQGRSVTAKSDIFALGLVLYELFTGRRAFTATSVQDLMTQHDAGDFTAPTTIVKSLDPAIERAIFRCLERDPARRPASAIALAASLPGGDPLAMALAAGETPSPELVAAAGGGDAAAVSPRAGVVWLAVTLVGLLGSFVLADRYSLLGQLPLSLEPRTLVDRARAFEERVGAGRDAVDRASGLTGNADVLNWIWSQAGEPAQRAILAGNRPSPMVLWYRSSPRPLVPTDSSQSPSPGNPPMNVTGMTVVALDLKGRLMEYGAVPVQVESLGPPDAPLDWKVFFDAAGLDIAAFQPVTPDWTPRTYADARQAWQGSAADLPGVPLRVEAASHRGVPVNFQIIGPWARPTRMQPPAVDRATEIVSLVASLVVVPLCVVGGVLLARRNLRLRRGDRRGAVTLAGIMFAVQMTAWIFGTTHFGDLGVEQQRLGVATAGALLGAALFGLMYLAFEPEIRRIWPQLLITWSRLQTGRVRDPLFGRDLLIGAAAGVLMTLVTFAHYALPDLLGWAPFQPPSSIMGTIFGGAALLGVIPSFVNEGLQNAIVGGVGLVLMRRITSHRGVGFALTTFVFAFLAARGQIHTGRIWLDLAIGVVLVLLVLVPIVRWGFVAGTVAFFVHFLTKDLPATLDPDRLYFGVGMTSAFIAAGIAVAGFWLARAGQPLFGDD